jgi:hypothetical protein
MSFSEPGSPVIDNFRKVVNLNAPKTKAELLELIKESPKMTYTDLQAIFWVAHYYRAQNTQAQAELVTTQANLEVLQNIVADMEGQIAAHDCTVR